MSYSHCSNQNAYDWPSDYPPILSLVGKTPLIPLEFAEHGLTVFAKCEFLNPSGSIKDRFARMVLLKAREDGLLTQNSIIVECSSGNTGISLAMIGASLGLKVTILISELASVERRNLISQLGGKVVLLPGRSTYQYGIDLSKRMAASDPRIFLPSQFQNPLSTADHRQTTGLEILQQMNGCVDAFVSVFGTGATLSGCGIAIKNESRNAQVVSVRPKVGDPSHSCDSHCFCIEGIAGNNFIPDLLRLAPIDRTVEVHGLDALGMTRRLHREFGLMVGASSGANVLAALQVAKELGRSARVVTILCDRAERYFSTELFGGPRTK